MKRKGSEALRWFLSWDCFHFGQHVGGLRPVSAEGEAYITRRARRKEDILGWSWRNRRRGLGRLVSDRSALVHAWPSPSARFYPSSFLLRRHRNVYAPTARASALMRFPCCVEFITVVPPAAWLQSHPPSE
ncbi:hypothetical protein MTO96_019141 [Rhipicephalus appendiculatus]